MTSSDIFLSTQPYTTLSIVSNADSSSFNHTILCCSCCSTAVSCVDVIFYLKKNPKSLQADPWHFQRRTRVTIQPQMDTNWYLRTLPWPSPETFQTLHQIHNRWLRYVACSIWVSDSDRKRSQCWILARRNYILQKPRTSYVPHPHLFKQTSAEGLFMVLTVLNHYDTFDFAQGLFGLYRVRLYVGSCSTLCLNACYVWTRPRSHRPNNQQSFRSFDCTCVS